MNTTPESVPKYEDTEEGDHSKESQSPKTENQREEARGSNGTDDFAIHTENERWDEDPWLDRIAVKGKGWKRMKLVCAIGGIITSIVVRWFLVGSV